MAMSSHTPSPQIGISSAHLPSSDKTCPHVIPLCEAGGANRAAGCCVGQPVCALQNTNDVMLIMVKPAQSFIKPYFIDHDDLSPPINKNSNYRLHSMHINLCGWVYKKVG